ncbi:MAG: hypothetical protein QGG36_18815 [Pirellulaceae bacterium]|nr:hypothetical protein [Pirellulaceae bacterium]
MPKLKVLSDITLKQRNPRLCRAVQESHCTVYFADLREYFPSPLVLEATNNPDGFDLTEFQDTTREIVAYDWLCREILCQTPDYIFLPYGSGKLFSEILHMLQSIQSVDTTLDPIRLSTSKRRELRWCRVLGATTKDPDSPADKLFARHRPQRQRHDLQLRYYKSSGFCGNESNIEHICEESLGEAHRMLNAAGVDSEHSGSARLALFLEKRDRISRWPAPRSLPIPRRCRSRRFKVITISRATRNCELVTKLSSSPPAMCCSGWRRGGSEPIKSPICSPNTT